MQNCEMNTELSHRIICLRLNLVVPDVAGTANTLSEEKISDKCFELMFAFDEVLHSIFSVPTNRSLLQRV